MNFIKTDINKSEEFFAKADKKISVLYEWSYYATEMLKAKIYMWSAKVTTGADREGGHIASVTTVDPGNSDLQTAKTALSNLLNQQFELVTDYAGLWTPEGKKNKELIFTLCFDKTN